MKAEKKEIDGLISEYITLCARYVSCMDDPGDLTGRMSIIERIKELRTELGMDEVFLI